MVVLNSICWNVIFSMVKNRSLSHRTHMYPVLYKQNMRHSLPQAAESRLLSPCYCTK